MTQVSSAVSMLESLKTKHYGCKWRPYGWIYRLLEHDVGHNLEKFSEKMIEYYWDEMIPRIQQGYSEQSEIEQNLEFFIQATLQAKLITEVDSKIANIIFLFGFYDLIRLEMQGTLAVNSASDLLDEYITAKQKQILNQEKEK